MEKAKKLINDKQLRSANRKPRYGMRKVSFGLASCMLGFMIYAAPTAVNAQEEAMDTASPEQSIPSESVETNSTPTETVAGEVSDEGNPSENAESELEIADLSEAQAVSAPENRAPKDISNDVQSKYVALTEEGHETKGTVKPDDGEAIGWEVFFTSPKGTIAGDYFTIDLSDNLSLKGIEPDHENEYPIEIDGTVVADGIRTDRSTIKYTFNENINDQRNVVVSIKGFAYIDKTKVPNNTENEKISIKLGDKVDEHNINVEYGKPFYTGNNLNGMSQITEFNPETGEFTQVFYINPDSKTITTSNRNWATGKVAMFIDGLTPDKTPSDVNYTKENTKVSIQKLPSGTKLPNAIIENPVKTDEQTMVKTTFRDGGIEITFAENGDKNLRHDNIDSPYIVTVKSIAAPSKTGNNVYSRATFYGDGTRFHVMDNNIVKTEGDTEAQGNKIGYFKEHHIYYTKVDGVLQEDKTFTLHSNKMEGYDYDTYFTNKNEIDDFKFVRVDTDKLVENPVYNTDGTFARGNYEAGKTKEVTYIYERDIKHGSFQEHHIYQSIDENGNVVSEETITWDGDETTGFDETSYETSKKDKDKKLVTSEVDNYGYKLVKVEASGDSAKKSEVKFDSNGAETTGNYINGEKLEVTYTYQKQVVTKGSFIEHHIYITKDQDGVETGRKSEDGELQEGKK
ncbi:YSIRK family Gram-positive signal peptide, partial [Facklamia hominis CCUG 36813]